MKEQVFQEITKFDPAGMKKLNDNLRWLFTKVRGGIGMKDVNGEIRLAFSAPASGVDNGGSLLINEKGLYVSGGEIDLRTNDGKRYVNISTDGVSASDIRADNVSPRYAGVREITVDVNASSEAVAAGDTVRSVSDALARLNGHQLEGAVVIRCAENTVIYGDAELREVCGGKITLDGSGAQIYGRLTIVRCASQIAINDLKITAAEGDAATVDGGGYTAFTACTLTSEQGAAIRARGGCRADISGCKLTAAEDAAAVESTAYAAVEDCFGTGAIRAKKAAVSAVGTVPAGGCINLGGAIISAEGTVPTGADGEAAAPIVETLQFAMAHSDSYAGGGWGYFEDNDIRQGWINGTRIRGCMWFDNEALRAALGGKTVAQATLRLYAQKNVGRGVAVSVELYGTTMDYSGRSGAPELTTDYGVIGTVEPGTATTITIPAQAAADLAAGTINGLMLYSADEEAYKDRAYSRNYARFDGETSGTEDTVPVLTVTASTPTTIEEGE